MHLVTINPKDKQLASAISGNQNCMMVYDMTLKLYERMGYREPWIGYFLQEDEQYIGSCGFKGEPQSGRIELAYFTFPEFEGKGFATEMCRMLLTIAMEAQPTILVTARTLPQENASTRILVKNGFTLQGTIHDPEDGEV